jgi:hypothetical protein
MTGFWTGVDMTGDRVYNTVRRGHRVVGIWP